MFPVKGVKPGINSESQAAVRECLFFGGAGPMVFFGCWLFILLFSLFLFLFHRIPIRVNFQWGWSLPYKVRMHKLVLSNRKSKKRYSTAVLAQMIEQGSGSLWRSLKVWGKWSAIFKVLKVCEKWIIQLSIWKFVNFDISSQNEKAIIPWQIITS